MFPKNSAQIGLVVTVIADYFSNHSLGLQRQPFDLFMDVVVYFDESTNFPIFIFKDSGFLLRSANGEGIPAFACFWMFSVTFGNFFSPLVGLFLRYILFVLRTWFSANPA